VLWRRHKNANEEEKTLAWARLASIFGATTGLRILRYVIFKGTLHLAY